MRTMIAALCLAALATASSAQQKTEAPTPAGYDAALAAKLGADDYGMKTYVFVILKTGAKADASTEEGKKAFAGHMANMGKLVADGKLVVAGPFQKNDRGYRGLFILNVKTVKEADELVATDPAVAAGYLAYDAFGWYGSAALAEVLPIHSKIQKKSH
jgi:uncharacterized protein YciI